MIGNRRLNEGMGKKEKEGIGRNGIKREGKEGEEGKIKMGNLS